MDTGRRLGPGPERAGETAPRNPWLRPIALLAVGILLSTVTINVWYLDTLLPPVGACLAYLALRRLRRTGTDLHTAWVIQCLRCALLAASYLLKGLRLSGMTLDYILPFVDFALQLALLAVLYRGLRTLSAEAELRPVAALIVTTALMVLADLPVIGGVVLLNLAVLALYAASCLALLLTARSLGRTAPAPAPAPARLGPWRLSALWLLGLFALTAAAWFGTLFLALPPSGPFTPGDVTIDGVPEELAKLLTPDDAAILASAEAITSEPMNMTFGADQRMEVVTLSAQLPDAKIAVVHYFRWLEGGPVWRDGIALWQSSHLTAAAPPSGSLVYEKNGASYRSALTGLTMSRDGAYGDRVLAGVQTPPGAENARGYILTVLTAGGGGTWFNCDFNYLHSGPFASFGKDDPAERILTGDYESRYLLWHGTEFSAWLENG